MARHLEHKTEPLLSRKRFALRMAKVIGLWFGVTLAGLAIGMAGYALTEGMPLIDAFVNAAMILSGMGPVGELKSAGGKLFAGLYALFSGLFIVVATGFLLAPVLHRVLHALHVDDRD